MTRVQTINYPTHHNIHKEERDGQRQRQALASKEDPVNGGEEASVLLFGHKLTSLRALLGILISIAEEGFCVNDSVMLLRTRMNSLVVVVCRLVLVVVVVVVVTVCRCPDG